MEVVMVKTQEEERSDRKGLYSVKAAEKLSERELEMHLCDVGPMYCADCELCEYGKEFLRRERAKMRGITQHELSIKYGASLKDVSAALARVKPIGYKKKDSAAGPARLYDEQQAAHALAGMWRMKAGQYERLAALWNERAKKAERMAAGLRADDMDEKTFSGLIEEDSGDGAGRGENPTGASRHLP